MAFDQCAWGIGVEAVDIGSAGSSSTFARAAFDAPGSHSGHSGHAHNARRWAARPRMAGISSPASCAESPPAW